MSTPTDLELMMYADGELEPARLAEVEAFLAGDEHARAKLTALDFAADIVRELSGAATPPSDVSDVSNVRDVDGIADLVMAKIAAGEALEEAAPAVKGGEVIPFRPKAVAKPVKASRSDSGRTIFLLAAAAVAAAAAMMLWARGEPPPPAGVAVLAPPSAPAKRAADQTKSEVAEVSPSPEGDAEVGVEVAAVDFGSAMGTIFYVPSDGAPGPMTTVVWVNDPAGEE